MNAERYLVVMKNNDSIYLRIYRQNPLLNGERTDLMNLFSNFSSIRFQNNLSPKQMIEEIFSVYSFPKLEKDFRRNYSGLIIHSNSYCQTEKILKFLNRKFISEN